jgi:predicted nucleic acid-binding protein
MKALLDSSVLVAAHLPTHPEHVASSAWLRQATRGAYDLVVAAHSLAEVYAVLTRLPLRPPISPKAAQQFLDQNVLKKGSVVALSPDEYRAVIDDAVRERWVGGIIYDALIAKVADRAHVDRLITLNVGHFQRVWPAGAARVSAPQIIPPPTLAPP